MSEAFFNWQGIMHLMFTKWNYYTQQKGDCKISGFCSNEDSSQGLLGSDTV